MKSAAKKAVMNDDGTIRHRDTRTTLRIRVVALSWACCVCMQLYR